MPLYPSNPPVTQALLKFGVSEEFVAAAPVVEYTCGTGRVVFEGVSKLKDRHGFLPAGSGTSGKSEVLTRTQQVVTREVRKPRVVTTGTHGYEGTFEPEVLGVPSTFGKTGTCE